MKISAAPRPEKNIYFWFCKGQFPCLPLNIQVRQKELEGLLNTAGILTVK